MIGSSAKQLSYEGIDVLSTKHYLEYMFGGLQGFIYRATLPYNQQRYKSYSIANAHFEDVKNCYISMNTFWRESRLDAQLGRDVQHVKRLNAFYVDIDCYKLGLSKEYVLSCLDHEFIGERIPVPTFIVDSGQGVYCIWKLRNEDRNALNRWQAVQDYLIDTLMELGADQSCSDAARVLRVPGTLNSKNGGKVKVLEFNDVAYSIYEIAKEYDIKPIRIKKRQIGITHPYNHATERQRSYVRALAQRLGLSEADYPDFTSFADTAKWIQEHKDAPENAENRDEQGTNLPMRRSINSILSGYCEDIMHLLALRKGEDCHRENALFLYRYFQRELGFDSKEALAKTVELNSTLNCPLSDREVKRATKSADRRIEKGLKYKFRRNKIIEFLAITAEELRELPNLSGHSVPDKEYKKEVNKRDYQKRLRAQGKITKREAVLQRRARILEFVEQGMNAEEIKAELQISRATYYRDIAALGTDLVLVHVKAYLKQKKETIEETAARVRRVKNVDYTAVICATRKVKKMLKCALSQNFRPPFRVCTALAVLPPEFTLPAVLSMDLPVSRSGDRGSGDDDGLGFLSKCYCLFRV